MKIICPYCNTPFNDNLENCPSCGAQNSAVVRKHGKTPLTIEDLKQWYQDKGLPPYSVTRFFIGENCTQPCAFGIYCDIDSGNFIVYKNKDNGQRAVRYRGTDEAYAVNELYQRLKQEIVNQKKVNAQRKGSANKPVKRKKRVSLGLILGLGIPASFILMALISLIFTDTPRDGYYTYNQTLYYHMDHVQPKDRSDWFWYDEATGWNGPAKKQSVPEQLLKNADAKAYFLSKTLPSDRTETDFKDSHAYFDAKTGHAADGGYYIHDNCTYYHLGSDLYSGWYYYDTYDDDWHESYYDDMPYDLQRGATAEDFFYTNTWDSSTQATDFADTEMYASYSEQLMDDINQGSSWEDGDDYDYSWDSGDSWDSGSTDWGSDW